MKVINRVKANQDFSKTIKNGQTLKNDTFTVHYCKNEKECVRIGISVSTKLGHAVTRNRVKRQIRAMCDSLINYASHTFDVVIIVRNVFLENDFNKNKLILNNILSKIGITK